MIPTLKAEFKKLITIRSTYLWIGIALVILGIYGIYGEGFKDFADAGPNGVGSLFIDGTLIHVATFIALFSGIISLLLMSHEYRYNTIIYTITASNSRTKVLFAKLLTIMAFTLVYAVTLTAIAIGFIFLGLGLAHHVLPHQDLNYLTYFVKSVFTAEGWAVAAFIFATLIRNQVGSFAALFILPNTVEGLLGLILKHDAVYMPFTALSQVISPATKAGAPDRIASTGYLSAPRGALIFSGYIVVAWLVTWYLFLRRDAA